MKSRIRKQAKTDMSFQPPPQQGAELLNDILLNCNAWELLLAASKFEAMALACRDRAAQFN